MNIPQAVNKKPDNTPLTLTILFLKSESTLIFIILKDLITKINRRLITGNTI